MSQLSENAVANLEAAQAVELLRVLELQAFWENLKENAPAKDVPTANLKDRQKAYEAYRSRLAAYSAKFRTFPLPELTQNSPKWVAQWLRVVRAVVRAADGPGVELPINLMAKAHRLGRRVAERLKRTPAATPTGSLATFLAAVEQLDGLIAWSESTDAPTVAEAPSQAA